MGADEWQASAAAGVVVSSPGAGERTTGVGAGLEIARGITDSWAARAEIAGSARSLAGAAGITLAIDVVRVIPFLDLGLAAAAQEGPTDGTRGDLGLQGGAGVEYLLTRRWALAALARFHYLPIELGGSRPPDGATPWLLTAGLRLGRVF